MYTYVTTVTKKSPTKEKKSLVYQKIIKVMKRNHQRKQCQKTPKNWMKRGKLQEKKESKQTNNKKNKKKQNLKLILLSFLQCLKSNSCLEPWQMQLYCTWVGGKRKKKNGMDQCREYSRTACLLSFSFLPRKLFISGCKYAGGA